MCCRTSQPRTFQPQASTLDFSTPDFSTMNSSTSEPYKVEIFCSFFGRMEKTKSPFEINWPLESGQFNPWLLNARLSNHELFIPIVKSRGLEVWGWNLGLKSPGLGSPATLKNPSQDFPSNRVIPFFKVQSGKITVWYRSDKKKSRTNKHASHYRAYSPDRLSCAFI